MKKSHKFLQTLVRRRKKKWLKKIVKDDKSYDIVKED